METFNKFGVGAVSNWVTIVMPPRNLSPDDALLFAAWLVTMAESQGEIHGYNLAPFAEYLKAVRES